MNGRCDGDLLAPPCLDPARAGNGAAASSAFLGRPGTGASDLAAIVELAERTATTLPVIEGGRAFEGPVGR